MEWNEINCIFEALDVLIDKYKTDSQNERLTEDERSDMSNDLAYVEILRGKYEGACDRISADYSGNQTEMLLPAEQP